jgi:hypothetical protein
MATFWPQGVPTLRKALRNQKESKIMVRIPIDREVKKLQQLDILQ